MKKLLKDLLGKNKVDLKQEVYNQNLLNQFRFKSYLPVSGSSLDFSTLRVVLNDIVVNNRKHIIEFGAGISTIYICKLAQMNNIDLKVLSIDHDKNWINILKTTLEEENILDYCTFIEAELMKCNLAIESNTWYNIEKIKQEIKGIKFDQVIVDGPLSYQKKIRLARYPALPFVHNNLDQNCSIVLNDIHRKGEKEVLKRWESEFEIKFQKRYGGSAFCIRGNYYNVF